MLDVKPLLINFNMAVPITYTVGFSLTCQEIQMNNKVLIATALAGLLGSTAAMVHAATTEPKKKWKNAMA